MVFSHRLVHVYNELRPPITAREKGQLNKRFKTKQKMPLHENGSQKNTKNCKQGWSRGALVVSIDEPNVHLNQNKKRTVGEGVARGSAGGVRERDGNRGLEAGGRGGASILDDVIVLYEKCGTLPIHAIVPYQEMRDKLTLVKCNICMKIRGSVESLSFVFPHPPEDKK